MERSSAMRVISGEFGGRILRTPRVREFRPTTDRVKESVFNILSNIVVWKDTTFCDLFCGSGNLGIEALSRGARFGVFVEHDRLALNILKTNLTLADTQRYRVHAMLVERFLHQSKEKHDLYFIDPPYAYERYEELLNLIATRHLIKPNGIALIEHDGRRELREYSHWQRMTTRSFGTTGITIFRIKELVVSQ